MPREAAVLSSRAARIVLGMSVLLSCAAMSRPTHGGLVKRWPPAPDDVKRIAVYQNSPDAISPESLEWTELKFTVDDPQAIRTLLGPLQTAMVIDLKGEGVMRRGNGFLELGDGTHMVMRFYADWTIVAEKGHGEDALEIPKSTASEWMKLAISVDK